MDSEYDENVKSVERWKGNNNDCTKELRKSVSWSDMYEVGVIGLIEQDDISPTNKSPLLSSPDPDDVYNDSKRQKMCNKFFSSPSNNFIDDKDNMFDFLSDEILVYIFSLVPKSCLASLSLVCKRFRLLCLDETFWTRYDLSFKTLPPHTLSYVLTRGIRALRLNSAAISSPIFDPEIPLQDDYRFKIEYLDLSAVHISIEDLEQLLEKCNNLKKLSLEACEVNDNICLSISRNTKLDTLDMAMCTNLTETGLGHIVKHCSMLECVNISWCNLSDKAVSNFCRNVSTSLVSCNLAGCLKSLSNEDIERLAQRCVDLTELDISDCIKLSSNVIESLVKHCDNLQILSISRSYKISSASILLLKTKASLCSLNMFGNIEGNMYPQDHIKYLKIQLPGVAFNSDMMSSIARPTVGIRRTSIWGIRCRE